MRQARTPYNAVRTRVEREVEVERVDFLDFVPRHAPRRTHILCELAYPVAFGGEPIYEAGEAVRKGYAATWAPWREEVGIRGVDVGWRGSWKGVEDVGVFYGAGHHQHWGDIGAVNG